MEGRDPVSHTWTSSSAIGKTPQVTISYTTTGGAPYSNAITTTANDGSYSWVSGNGGVPDTISPQVKIRIVDASDGVAYDDTDDNFMIVSDFTLGSPNGSATYEVDDVVRSVGRIKGRLPMFNFLIPPHQRTLQARLLFWRLRIMTAINPGRFLTISARLFV